MARVELVRVDTEAEDNEPVFISLGRGGEVLLGRGPLLKIEATSISRKQGKLSLDKDTGEVKLTTLHRNPIFVRKASSDWLELGTGEDSVIEEGDEIKFQENSLNFSVKMILNGIRSDESIGCVEDKASEIKSELVKDVEVCPKPTGLIVKKKRKLPNWMAGDSTSMSNKKGKTSMEKAMENTGTAKISENTTNTIEKTYNGNVNFITGKTPLNASNVHAISDKENSEPLETETKMKPTPLGRVNDNEMPCQASTSLNKSPIKVGPSNVGVNKELKPEETFTYPVLVTADDLVDSDDEQGKENFDKNLTVKKKIGQKAPTTKKDAIQKKPSCPFGDSCYRKKPTHRQEEAHPGDPDYVDPEAEGEHVGEVDDRPECEYGNECYRKNPAHKRDFKHTKKPQPKRKAKAKVPKKKGDDDLDDSFIDDDDEEPVDDTDDDEDWHLSSDDD